MSTDTGDAPLAYSADLLAAPTDDARRTTTLNATPAHAPLVRPLRVSRRIGLPTRRLASSSACTSGCSDAPSPSAVLGRADTTQSVPEPTTCIGMPLHICKANGSISRIVPHGAPAQASTLTVRSGIFHVTVTRCDDFREGGVWVQSAGSGTVGLISGRASAEGRASRSTGYAMPSAAP